MSILRKLFVRASGNQLAQRLLEKNVQYAQYLMGIGAGAGVLVSGERTIVQTLEASIVPPYCIFDVGSNKGQFLQLVIDSLSTEDYSIHCFEPGHETFKQLSAAAGSDERIRPNNIGISREKGSATLHYQETGSTLASLTKRKLDHFNIQFDESETVEIDTIDNYCSDNGIEHIHLLKIDIEGHEIDALAGAQRMFENKQIDIVTFEFGGCNIDTRTFFQEFWYFFRQHDMRLFRITPSGYLYPIETYKEIDEQFRAINYLAIANRLS